MCNAVHMFRCMYTRRRRPLHKTSSARRRSKIQGSRFRRHSSILQPIMLCCVENTRNRALSCLPKAHQGRYFANHLLASCTDSSSTFFMSDVVQQTKKVRPTNDEPNKQISNFIVASKELPLTEFLLLVARAGVFIYKTASNACHTGHSHNKVS